MWLGLGVAVVAAVVGWSLRSRLAAESDEFALQAVEKWRKERDAAKLRVKQLASRLRTVEKQLKAIAPGGTAADPPPPRGKANGLTVLNADFVADLLADQVEDVTHARVVEVGDPDVLEIVPRTQPHQIAARTLGADAPEVGRPPIRTAGNGASLWKADPPTTNARRGSRANGSSSTGHSLNDLGEIPLEALKRLRAWGVHNTTDLRDYFRANSEPGELASALGVEFRRVRRWKVLVDFLEIPGLEPKNAWLLEISGVGSLKELAKQDAQELAAWMSGLNEDQGLELPVPELATVRSWVRWASKKVATPRRPHASAELNRVGRLRDTSQLLSTARARDASLPGSA